MPQVECHGGAVKVRLKPDTTTETGPVVRLKPDTTYAGDGVLPRHVRCLGNGCFDLCAQFGRNFRIKAEPRLPRGTHLVQQHAESVDGRVAASLRRCEQRCV